MLEEFNVHNRKFRAITNVENGDVDERTIFHYRQKGSRIWATYSGGEIVAGLLHGHLEGNKMSFTYEHLNQGGIKMSGKCDTVIRLENRKYHLSERWQWTCGDFSEGTSELIEIESAIQ